MATQKKMTERAVHKTQEEKIIVYILSSYGRYDDYEYYFEKILSKLPPHTLFLPSWDIGKFFIKSVCSVKSS